MDNNQEQQLPPSVLPVVEAELPSSPEGSISLELLRYFIDLNISYKEFITVSQDIGEQLFLLDEEERFYHIEFYTVDEGTPKETLLAKIYTIRTWRESHERFLLSKHRSELERQAACIRDETISAARKKLSVDGKRTEREVDVIMERINANDPMYYELGVKLGLINPRVTPKRRTLMDEIDAL